MKKAICLACVFACVVGCFAGCGKATTPIENEQPSTEVAAPDSKPVESKVNEHALTGEYTGTDKTYTGFEPLSEISFEVNDSVTLSNECIGYSYGVAKNGVPHDNSVNAQKKFDDYSALALDNKSNTNTVYLTFDCGYENGYTEKVLDSLKEKNVTAAFFVTLDYVKSSPEIVARMIKEGHIVGNHSATHPSFPSLSRSKMAQEIQEVDNYLRLHFGYSSPYFRFPKGEYSDNALELVQSIGYQSVFWSVAYADWDTSVVKGKDYAVKTVTDRLHKGAVILLHSVSVDNANAMGEIIDKTREMGYEFGSL